MMIFFFFNDTATTEIYTLSLHDALPISKSHKRSHSKVNDALHKEVRKQLQAATTAAETDRKSTRLNSSHLVISYAVFCLKKKKTYLELELRTYAYRATPLDPDRQSPPPV